MVQSFPRSAVPAAAPPHNPCMALVVGPLAVKAQARSTRCSSDWSFTFLFSGCLMPSVLLSENSSNEIVHFSCFAQLQARLHFFVPVAAMGRYLPEEDGTDIATRLPQNDDHSAPFPGTLPKLWRIVSRHSGRSPSLRPCTVLPEDVLRCTVLKFPHTGRSRPGSSRRSPGVAGSGASGGLLHTRCFLGGLATNHEVSRRKLLDPAVAVGQCSLVCEFHPLTFLAYVRHEAVVRVFSIRLRVRATSGALSENSSRLLPWSSHRCSPLISQRR